MRALEANLGEAELAVRPLQPAPPPPPPPMQFFCTIESTDCFVVSLMASIFFLSPPSSWYVCRAGAYQVASEGLTRCAQNFLATGTR